MHENTNLMVPADSGEMEIDLLAILDSWKRHLSIIILAGLIGGLIGYAYTLLFVTPKYRATASMYVVSASANSAFDVSDLNFGTSLTNDYITLVKSRTMLEHVVEATGDPITASQLGKMLNVTHTSNTRIIEFTVTSSSPQQAMRLANACVKEAIEFLPEVMGLKDNNPREIDMALLPSSPYNLNYLRNVAVGMAAFAVVTMVIYALLEILNDRFDNSDDVEKVLGISPIAVIPENNQHHRKGKGYYYYYYSNAKKGS